MPEDLRQLLLDRCGIGLALKVARVRAAYYHAGRASRYDDAVP
jgi:hypothetical protein